MVALTYGQGRAGRPATRDGTAGETGGAPLLSERAPLCWWLRGKWGRVCSDFTGAVPRRERRSLPGSRTLHSMQAMSGDAATWQPCCCTATHQERDSGASPPDELSQQRDPQHERQDCVLDPRQLSALHNKSCRNSHAVRRRTTHATARARELALGLGSFGIAVTFAAFFDVNQIMGRS